jgi:putative cell wall-binding protein
VAVGQVTAVLAVLTLLVLAGGAAAGQEATPVVRLSGADRIATAVAVSTRSWEVADSAVLATAQAFPDALVGGPLASSLDAPLLLTLPDRLPSAVADELERLGVSRVVILGGEAAVGREVADAVAALPGGPTVERVAGRDRFRTAATAATSADTGHDEVVVASGTAFADAVAGGAMPAAAGGRQPVLLVTRDLLPEATRVALAELRPARVTLLGGPAAVGHAVEEELRGIVDDVVRIAGPHRFATSAAALETALAATGDAPRTLVVATGTAFPDALSAGALAGRVDGLLVTVPRFRMIDELDALLRRHAWERAVVVGGDVAVDGDVLVVVAAALAGTERPPPPLHTVGTAAGYRGTARPLPDHVAREMEGVSWRPGCPVGPDQLVLLELTHRDDAGRRTYGELVVAADVARPVLDAFARAYDAGFPIARMRRIDDYGGDDDASMADDNTSAFNCRHVAGTTRWSEHAYGTAVDVNPVRNPYVRGGTVEPAAGSAYLDRRDVRPGMATRPGALVDAFDAIGWGWGGDWSSAKDYMHFSASGR